MPFFIGYYLEAVVFICLFIFWGNQAARGSIDLQQLHDVAPELIHRHCRA